jgi:hypothetical protein
MQLAAVHCFLVRLLTYCTFFTAEIFHVPSMIDGGFSFGQ